MNGGFFVIADADGVVGDSAGDHRAHGRLLHDATNGRVAAILRDGGPAPAAREALDQDRPGGRARRRRTRSAGLNRAPGLIRDCGGRTGDSPTSAPLMDVTCKNPNELVAFTPEFGSPLPTGAGSEAVLDARQGRLRGAAHARTSARRRHRPRGDRHRGGLARRHATVGTRLRLRTKDHRAGRAHAAVRAGTTRSSTAAPSSSPTGGSRSPRRRTASSTRATLLLLRLGHPPQPAHDDRHGPARTAAARRGGRPARRPQPGAEHPRGGRADEGRSARCRR